MSSADHDPLSNARAVSEQWLQWRQSISIEEYERRFRQLEANGSATHGEADFIAACSPRTVLDAGCGTGRVAIELARRGFEVTGVDLDADMIAAARAKAPELTWHVADLATVRVGCEFDLVALPGNVMLYCRASDRGRIVANLADHLHADGTLVAGFSLRRDGYALSQWDQDCRNAGLELTERFATWERSTYSDGDYHVSVHRRVSERTRPPDPAGAVAR